jgi:hypothetical protein
MTAAAIERAAFHEVLDRLIELDDAQLAELGLWLEGVLAHRHRHAGQLQPTSIADVARRMHFRHGSTPGYCSNCGLSIRLHDDGRCNELALRAAWGDR